MIDLRNYTEPLVAFLDARLEEFREQHPRIVSPHVALYSCPWSGWVSLCFDSQPRPQQNCPDFEFVEFAMFEAPQWRVEYEQQPSLDVVDLDGVTQVVDPEIDGDEGVNRVFFAFLKSILTSEQARATIRRHGMRPSRLGVQMLDSAYEGNWEPTERDGTA